MGPFGKGRSLSAPDAASRHKTGAAGDGGGWSSQGKALGERQGLLAKSGACRRKVRPLGE
eukprot:5893454-Alexandrium_andersonii.AAC.1